MAKLRKALNENRFRFFSRAIVPPTILNWAIDGKITEKEFLLLAMIDAYGQAPSGFFASNDYIAKSLKVSVRSVQLMFAKLKKLGAIIYHYDEDTQERIIETCWKDLPQFLQRGDGASFHGGDEVTLHGGDEVSLHPNVFTKVNTKEERNPSVAAERHPPRVSESLGLVDDEGIPSHTKINMPMTWAIEYKERLQAIWPSALASNNWRIGNQAKEFAILLKHESAMRIDVVLQWFMDQEFGKKGQEGLPNRCKSPASFRKCWDWISDKYDAQQGKDQKAEGLTESQRAEFDPCSHEETEQLAQMIEDALQLSWPPRAMKELESLVARAAYGYLHFLKWCRKKKKTPITDWENHLPDLDEFVFSWCEMIDKQIGHWAEWNGDLTRFQFKPEHEAFGKMLKRWIDISSSYHQKITTEYTKERNDQ